MKDLVLGPPRYYCPVCIRWPWGFIGGPFRYLEVSEVEKDRESIIVDGVVRENSWFEKVEVMIP